MNQPFDKSCEFAVPLPIPAAARNIANHFAAAQPTEAKAHQVRRNTLAVWVMNDYCQLLGIATDLAQSDSWNGNMQLMADVADLVLPGIGRLECRPMAAADPHCWVPPETWALRIGYGVVELSEDLQTARLLGFTPSVETETLEVQALRSPEALIDHVHSLMRSPMDEALESTAATLSQWFDRVFEADWVATGWQTLGALVDTTELTPAFNVRSHLLNQLDVESGIGIRKGKLINLSLRIGTEQVLLLIRLQSQAADTIHINVQVYPVSRPCLPPDLELRILEASGEVFMQAQARQADNYIQLQFSGKPGEPFSTQIKLEDIYHLEQFIV